MQTFLMIILALASVVLIISILMQSSNSAGLSGVDRRRSGAVVRQEKSQGYEGILNRISTVSAILFIILSLILVMMEG